MTRVRSPYTRLNCVKCGRFFYSLNFYDELCHRCWRLTFLRQASAAWPVCWPAYCLGLTAGRQPRHPLYLSGDAELLRVPDALTAEVP